MGAPVGPPLDGAELGRRLAALADAAPLTPAPARG
ncbi:MAG: hypothetical protein JWM64_1670, partial [Frankiales bacterium]|nr:hypothetical protein [Frankiales bacterium]